MRINLDTPCDIEQKSVTQDPVYGNEIIGWTKLATVWCEVRDVLPTRSEEIKNGLAIATDKTRVRMRYRDDVNSSMRLNMRGNIYQIVAGPAEIGRKEYMEFMVERYSA